MSKQLGKKELEASKLAPIKYKSTDFKSEINENSRTVSGYFASFDTIDSDNDVIKNGAFSKSIKERGPETDSNRQIKFLHQHNVLEVAGPIKDLFEDSFGRGFVAEVEKTPMGDVILERYKNGTYREHSIGFQYMLEKCDWIQMESDVNGQKINIDVFECKELNLFEGSVVTFGANENTPFTGFKGTVEDRFKQLEDEFKFLVKHSPNFEFEMQLRQYFYKQNSLLTELAAKDTKDSLKPDENNEVLEYYKSKLKIQ